MPIILKAPGDIERMRQTARLAVRIVSMMRQAAVAGTTTFELDEIARVELEKAGAVSASKNYPTYRPGEGFPGHTCISINEEVVHGVPTDRALQDGDIVTLDVLPSLGGYCASRAITVPVGRITAASQRLIDVTNQTLAIAIQNIQPGRKWSQIARLMQHCVESNGYSVLREFVGHGIGRKMMEDPKVPNFVGPSELRNDWVLRGGMTLTIEPMVLMGRREVELMPDQWTVVTSDGMRAAHARHTIAVTEGGVDVLTEDSVCTDF